MNDNLIVVLLASAIVYGTPLLYAALGETLTERSGVLNLGLEGMMLMGAVSGFWLVQIFDGPAWLVLTVAVVVAALAGTATALIHAVLVVSLRANQIVSGIAITIFAGVIGLSAYLGTLGRVGGVPAKHHFRPLNLFGLTNPRADIFQSPRAGLPFMGLRDSLQLVSLPHQPWAQTALCRGLAGDGGRRRDKCGQVSVCAHPHRRRPRGNRRVGL